MGRRPFIIAVAIAAALVHGGCATVPPPTSAPASAAPTPANVEPPPPNVNLSGFPLAYRQGYADGCASSTAVERKDASRFASDGNYRTGWTDGRALCGRR